MNLQRFKVGDILSCFQCIEQKRDLEKMLLRKHFAHRLLHLSEIPESVLPFAGEVVVIVVVATVCCLAAATITEFKPELSNLLLSSFLS
jgi:hypothetical protein